MPNVKISIPVYVGGYTGQYTGQREEWQSIVRGYDVTIDDGKVTLACPVHEMQTIEFDLTELETAVKFARQHGQEV